MTPFRYEAAADASAAIAGHGGSPAARYLGGGTNLVDLMRESVERPDLLVDVSRLSRAIEETPDGGLRLGAGATNTEVAAHPAVRARFPLLARAILNGASGQIRNMATIGGNLMQRTRCPYFYDTAARCNKRQPGAGCDAIGGFNRLHAVLGASDACVAVHPSDLCVALAALDATVEAQGPAGARRIPFTAFHRLPGATPQVETELAPGELITAVTVPGGPFAARSAYRKVRDRASFAFAVVAVGAALDLDEGGRVRTARLAFGGLAHKPWRALKAEAALAGGPATREAFAAAAAAELADAVPLSQNGFKIELARRVATAVLTELAGSAAR